ncbi:MAG: methyltransferase domain-containing protein [Candidatus Dojkabacteria bacterium]|nr:methyltransferase domain-containing protein [Candidatus Dojkabacteria bacterium]
MKNLKSNPFKDLLATVIAAEKGWTYTEKDHTNFDIRVFLGDGKIYVSVRLTNESLHKREYKEFSKSGSLRPTIAAALVRLTTGMKHGKLVDNFCGSGTILCEAYNLGNEIYGGDVDAGSVEFTKKNLKSLDFEELDNIKLGDAIKTTYPDNTFDYAISNLPWDKQIEVESFTGLYIDSLREYKRILKDKFVMSLLVKKPELMISLIGSVFENVEVSKIQLSLVGQQPEVITVRSK